MEILKEIKISDIMSLCYIRNAKGNCFLAWYRNGKMIAFVNDRVALALVQEEIECNL